MIDRQYIPLFVFAICLALGLALAVFTNEWPTALAIALSGCALGLAMRTPEGENHDTAFLEEDLAEIRTMTGRQDEDITLLRTSIDEVAEIVESIATDMQRQGAGADTAQADSLRGAIDAMGKRIAAVDGLAKEAVLRLDALEQAATALKNERAQGVQSAEMPQVQPVALAVAGTSPRSASAPLATGSITERAGRLRERFVRARKTRKISATPVFDADRMPVSLLIDDPEENPSVEGDSAAIRHALSLIGASEDPDSRIFVRVSPDMIASPDLADALAEDLETAGEGVSRLVALLPQASLAEGTPRALDMLLDAGARFGIERMNDWSVDLDALARQGLAVIAVDGPAMAKSAMSQKGDPTRLRQVLHARGVQLLAGQIETRMQLDAVNSLLPDLLAGPGLGEATLLDASA